MDFTTTFSLEGYKFTEAHLNMNLLTSEEGLIIDPVFEVSGVYKQNEGLYTLYTIFKALTPTEEALIEVKCEAAYRVHESPSLDEFPHYFYGNALAIIFPYIRAFVSTLTLQANYNAFLLPTMNLSSMSETVKENTKLV